jgi:hypothetical protein
MLGVWQGTALRYFSVPDLQAEGSYRARQDLVTALLLDGHSASAAAVSTLLCEADRVSWLARRHLVAGLSSGASDPDLGIAELRLPWQLRSPPLPGLPALSWLPPREGCLQVAGVTAAGGLGWAALRPFTDDAEVVASAQVSTSSFRAVTLTGPNQVAGVTEHGVCWVRVGGGRPRQTYHQADVGEVIACFPSPLTNELLLVGPTGELVRLPAAD